MRKQTHADRFGVFLVIVFFVWWAVVWRSATHFGEEASKGDGDNASARTTVPWVANKRFVSSKFKFKFPRARNLEIIGLVLSCIEAKFCK